MLNAWHAFSSLDRLIDNVMTDVMRESLGTATRGIEFTPDVDIKSNDNEYLFHVDVPGVKKEDLEVVLENGALIVKGQRRYEHGDKDRVWLGRSYGAFARSFQLPDDVNAEGLAADLADGVLTIRVPKHPKAQPRRIQIGGAQETKQLAE